MFYSLEYLSNDKYLTKFMVIYVYFVGNAVTVTSGNYVCLFIVGN